MKVGDLAVVNTGTKHHGIVGLVISKEPMIHDDRPESLLTILYPSGECAMWSDVSVEAVSENR